MHIQSARLKKQDTQTIWILTNSDDPSAGNADERNRIHEQFKNQLELHRTLNLFHMPPSSTSSFDMSSFYHTMFYDASDATAPDTADGLAKQAAFAIHTYEDMMEESLRKRYRKRRLATLRFSITKTVKLSVEVYALRVRQMKPSPVNLDAETNVPLQSVTKWLCNHTGSFLTSDQINTYLPYGGHRVYLTKDDMVQIKRFDAAGGEDIAGSSAAFVALHRSMTTKDKVAVCRFSMRDNSPPRVAALLAQLQKHYASIQALALDEDVLAFDDKDDSTLPDAAGFARKKVVAAVEAFKEACGGDELHKESVKRKAAAAPKREKNKVTKTEDDDVDCSVETYKTLAASGVLAKKTVVELKRFLSQHGLSTAGKKADLLATAMEFLQTQ
ncbi:hypothetical protein DYB32_005447 [Aphanomyces invadans]|uniref:SAP domain-containing protein n=1 Tax=Aphanomyces invadans TaxID=157072 RepID=A0A3R6WKZ3_9STRA|nr:hypothetical protein DYB32_005447 [Aphanomyces invadans]